MNHFDTSVGDRAPAGCASTPQSVRERLMQRVQLSHALESQFHTVRRDAGPWLQAQAVVRAKALASTAIAHSALADIAPGASYEQPGNHTLQEVVLLSGQLFIGTEALDLGDAVCAPQRNRHGEVHTDVGALFYVHGSLDPAAYA